MKNIVIKFISTILAFILIISSIPIPLAYAESLDAIKEAMNDYSSKNPAGDWQQAIFKDGLELGTFHYAVQKYIRNKNPNIEKKELTIHYKNGKTGRADIAYYDVKNDWQCQRSRNT